MQRRVSEGGTWKITRKKGSWRIHPSCWGYSQRAAFQRLGPNPFLAPSLLFAAVPLPSVWVPWLHPPLRDSIALLVTPTLQPKASFNCRPDSHPNLYPFAALCLPSQLPLCWRITYCLSLIRLEAPLRIRGPCQLPAGSPMSSTVLTQSRCPKLFTEFWFFRIKAELTEVQRQKPSFQRLKKKKKSRLSRQRGNKNDQQLTVTQFQTNIGALNLRPEKVSVASFSYKVSV